MENIMYKPVIGVVMCRNRLKGHQTQTLQEKYLNAIVNAGGLPIALPHALAEPELLNAVVDKLDGIYLPGSPSNVQPHLYGENGDEPDADPGRDLLSMALINAALERRIPFSPSVVDCRNWLSPPAGLCIVVCSSSLSSLNIAKILNCPSSSSMRRPIRLRFRKEDCCRN